MADETATDTTEAETSTTEATETDQTTETTDKAEAEAEAAAADAASDKSLMNGGKGPDDEDEPDPAQLPERYELTAPEGFEISEELLAAADPVFRELGLDNDGANKLMPLVPQFADALFKAQSDAFQAQATDWAKQAKADKEIGGANWSETESLVAKALDKFGAPAGSEFRQLLDQTKLGNHPEMIRMFRKIGAALSEDGTLARSDTGAPVKVAREEILYPDDVKKEGVV